MEKILVTGASGLLGSHLVPILREVYESREILIPSSTELDLTNAIDVDDYFNEHEIYKVFHCAGLVSGMFGHSHANDLRWNTMIGLNTIFSAAYHNVQHFINVGSTCIYPKYAQAPVPETAFLTGAFEPSCEAFALAKAVSIKYAEILNKYNRLDFKTVMLPNLYGPGEAIKSGGNHCILDIMMKMIEAINSADDSVHLFGDGTAVRSFMHAQDAALALLHVDRCLDSDLNVPIINVGSNQILTINELAQKIKKITGFTGKIEYDDGNPEWVQSRNGHPNKVEDLTKIKTRGYEPENCIDIDSGLKQMYTYVDLALNTSTKEEIDALQ